MLVVDILVYCGIMCLGDYKLPKSFKQSDINKSTKIMLSWTKLNRFLMNNNYYLSYCKHIEESNFIL